MMQPVDVVVDEPADYTIPGLRVRRFEDSAPWHLVVHASKAQEEWQPVVSGRHKVCPYIEQPPVPTTIVYRGGRYWIHEVAREQTGPGWVYRMRRAPDNEPHVKQFVLTADNLRAVEETRTKAKHSDKYGKYSILYEWAIGFLPARAQNALAHRWYFSPDRGSEWNALVTILLGIGVTLAAVLTQAMNIITVGFYLILDGMFRWVYCMQTEEPRGLYLLEMLDGLYIRLMGLPETERSGYPKPGRPAMPSQVGHLPGIPDMKPSDVAPEKSSESRQSPLPAQTPQELPPVASPPTPAPAQSTRPARIDESIQGFSILCFDADSPWPLVVEAARRQQERWIPGGPTEPGLPPSLGTAVQYNGSIYEVVEEMQRGDRWIYRMRLWPEADRWGRLSELSAEVIAEEDSEQACIDHTMMLNQASWYHAITFGFLPSGILEDLDQMMSLNFSLAGASRYNAAVEFVVGITVFGLLLLFRFTDEYERMSQAISGGFEREVLWLTLVVAATGLDGIVRFLYCDRTHRPCGPLLLEFINRLVIRLKEWLCGPSDRV